MVRLKEAGKIRAIGVSNFAPGYLDEQIALGRVETIQLCYSLLFRAVEHKILPLCREQEIGILCYSPLCQGLLTGKFASPDDVPAGRARSRLFAKDRPEARHDEPGCEAEAFDAVAEVRRIAKSIGRPMGHVALAWLLAQPGVTSAIAGARNGEQARDNALAAELDLTDDAIAELAAATEKVKQLIGPNADMWQTKSRLEK
jgi:aryl-alcohol dehydrogenase-like predicted oxidoreductase